jgi:hypothetical protein
MLFMIFAGTTASSLRERASVVRIALLKLIFSLQPWLALNNSISADEGASL